MSTTNPTVTDPRWTIEEREPWGLLYGNEVWLDWEDIPAPAVVSNRLRHAAFDALVAAVHDADTLRQARQLAGMYKRAIYGTDRQRLARMLADLLSPPVSPDTPTPTASELCDFVPDSDLLTQECQACSGTGCVEECCDDQACQRDWHERCEVCGDTGFSCDYGCGPDAKGEFVANAECPTHGDALPVPDTPTPTGQPEPTEYPGSY